MLAACKDIHFGTQLLWHSAHVVVSAILLKRPRFSYAHCCQIGEDAMS